VKTGFLHYTGIPVLILVFLLSGVGEVSADPTGTAALSPPSKPLGEQSATNNTLAQRVVLYEETPGNPEGRQADGSVVWSTEASAYTANTPPELVVRGDINIPERKMGVTIRLRHDTGLASASHTIEFQFQLPPEFDGGGIFNVPGFWMKPNMQTRGAALTGLAVKVTDGYFLIGLSNTPADRDRNIPLLRDRPWFDVPIVYNNHRRAILAVEKGAPGEQSFQQAFGAWKD
jgi:hypothetical protein